MILSVELAYTIENYSLSLHFVRPDQQFLPIIITELLVNP